MIARPTFSVYSFLHTPPRSTLTKQAFRQVARPISLASKNAIPRRSFLQARLLSSETKAAIDKAVATSPVVLFMKGTPETPQCGFSRASIQILGVEGVDPEKFTAYNVLEDEELRSGKHMMISGLESLFNGLYDANWRWMEWQGYFLMR